MEEILVHFAFYPSNYYTPDAQTVLQNYRKQVCCEIEDSLLHATAAQRLDTFSTPAVISTIRISSTLSSTVGISSIRIAALSTVVGIGIEIAISLLAAVTMAGWMGVVV